ncbi:unnamed protein product [Arabidopsis halleri]
MPKNKAPGPDGFSVEYLWEAWDVVGNDIVEAVQDFFSTGHLPKYFNATAITLIPKVPGADTIPQFRPISCCTTVYKIIARLLKQKLKLFISDTVQGNQVGFVQGRQLCENVLLASELVNNFHVSGTTTRGCLQVDLAKAYDNLNWQFLLNVLNALELPPQFIGWLQQCFTTPSFSIAFNGELIGFFPGKRGLRQGDPISSLLFVLAMDVLSKKLDKGAMNSSFGLHPQCYAPMITHLSFADDILVFCDGEENSFRAILDILEDFRLASGLGINKNKSALFLDGANFQDNQLLAARLQIIQGSLPVRYLGVPLTTCKLRKQDYQPLIDRILGRFNPWTRLSDWNKVLGLKLIWMIFAAGGSLWVSWVRRNLIGSKCFWDIENLSSGSWIRKSLCKLRPLARPFLVCEVSSGFSCKFWSDNWTGLGPLLEITGVLGPRIYGLPRDVVVVDALRDGEWWISRSRSRNPIISMLLSCLPPPSIVNSQIDAADDCFLWKVGDKPSSNVFSTAITWDHLHPLTAKVD